MATIAFKQVDVFTDMPYHGNPVAVVLDARGLAPERMQRIARWTNLSETTFVLPPTSAGADYRVRIFTPASELPFAGHPTIGTAHALLEAGLVAAPGGQLVQECAAGLVRLKIEHDAVLKQIISFALPAATATKLTPQDAQELQDILGAPLDATGRPRLVDAGPRWIIAQLHDAAAVVATRPDLVRMKAQDLRLRATGVVIFGAHEPGAPAQVEVRAFAPTLGVDEDPVCGSGNGCVAVYIRDTGQTARFGRSYLAAQGQVVQRAGALRVRIEADQIFVGGASVTCVEGTIVI
jgi:PhzF family phenazine biosynthesis protein